MVVALVCLLAGFVGAETGPARNDAAEHRPTPRASESRRATPAPTASRKPEEGPPRGSKGVRGSDKDGEGTIRRLFESLDGQKRENGERRREAPARPRGADESRPDDRN